ncbi:hypothetical protein GUITHDRAFT_120446 [Guillardia theta CCMP2712]|uniref:RWP-RK domain-containing protein n=1 Tax=Guillardia theta (strain CCMP2712) TaxID=905079 RepID=L1IBD8_GUITC|nr:hypothetical protein GUITHDRAFT_120446 [Guillardia theta CCMP2712]EKX33382.1 hypothetical protein GUITHDRAFT_120446 [Guillardia theta CCMP2712]|eukprot:XP_005820362.1 hypothetical protein GUITHDRAFT_120446 [Guillardia theta CCMP2712]
MFGPTFVTIHVRKKAGDSAKPQASKIFLTASDLQRLLVYKQVDAAKLLGVSLTALKNACRQLGLESWPKERSQLLAARRREAWDVREWFGGQEEGISATEGTEQEAETVEEDGTVPILDGAPYLEQWSREWVMEEKDESAGN